MLIFIRILLAVEQDLALMNLETILFSKLSPTNFEQDFAQISRNLTLIKFKI